MSSSAIVYSGLQRSKSSGSAILVDVAGKWVSLCCEVGEAGGTPWSTEHTHTYIDKPCSKSQP